MFKVLNQPQKISNLYVMNKPGQEAKITMFIEANGTFVNLNHVVSMTPRGDDILAYRLNTVDGESHIAWLTDIEALTSAVVPAAPGYGVVGVTVGDTIEAWIEPVIAWRVSYDGDALPVTLDCTNRDDPILYPDGRVVLPHSQIWNSIEDWLNDVRTSPRGALLLQGRGSTPPVPAES